MWNIKKVASFLTLDRATIYRGIAAGTFPKQVHITARRVAWREEDVLAVANGTFVPEVTAQK